MLTLSLFRHAKSSWQESGDDDFDRPLAPRGEDAAPAMGAYMRSISLSPRLVLCSPALRAVQTARLTLAELPEPPEVYLDERLYNANSDTLLAIIRDVGSDVSSLMIIGHNPGLHVLAVDCVGESRADLIAALARKFPTAALAVVAFDENSWRDINPRHATLKVFMSPKRLPAPRKAE